MNPEDFQKIIERELSPLGKLGYSFSEVLIESEELLGNSLQTRIVNQEYQRSINIDFFYNHPITKKQVLMVYIEQLNPPPLEWDDYTSTGTMAVKCPELSILSGSVNDKLTICLQQVMANLNEKFAPVIRGKEFKTDHTDWGGLK